MTRVVVLRALKLGDFLVGVPALRAIRGHWPRHHVQLACPGWLGELVELTGCVDEVVPVNDFHELPDRLHAPNVAINLHGKGPQSTVALRQLDPWLLITHGADGAQWVAERNERLRWCELLAYYGIPVDPEDLRLTAPTAPPRQAAVVVHPRAAFGSKCWPAERFAELAGALEASGDASMFVKAR